MKFRSLRMTISMLTVLLAVNGITVSAAEVGVVVDKPIGDIVLCDYEDNSYDWGHSIIKTDSGYQMWWVRGNPHDEIFYAESADLVNWHNVQPVIIPAVSVDDIKAGNYTEEDQELMHVGSPTVSIVNGTYYIFYEAPGTIDTSDYSETDNQIFMATSTDGKTWSKYPNNERPEPVISIPADAGDGKKYGVGQPKVLYKDGQFELYYTADTRDYRNKIYTATSADGITWVGRNGQSGQQNHDAIIEGNTLDVKYSTALNQYVVLFSTKSTSYVDREKGEALDYSVFYISSADRYDWGATNINSFAYKNKNNILQSQLGTPKTRSFPGFVTNATGMVEGTTFYAVFMSGKIHDQSADWRQQCLTWNGTVSAFNPPEYADKEVLLPSVVSNTSDTAGSSAGTDAALTTLVTENSASSDATTGAASGDSISTATHSSGMSTAAASSTASGSDGTVSGESTAGTTSSPGQGSAAIYGITGLIIIALGGGAVTVAVILRRRNRMK